MRIAFRTDASLQIGTGHVMRCLTLADALREQGAECQIVCREHEGHLMDHIRSRGYEVHALPKPSANDLFESDLAHASWLGVNWSTDVQQTQQLLQNRKFDWLVVDHYGIDCRWELAMRSICKNIMVIDDLADRCHDCDLLLDQNIVHGDDAYQNLIHTHAVKMLGPEFALLRPEFSHWKKSSLERRAKNNEIRTVLVTMGGVDQNNYTAQILKHLNNLMHTKIKEIIVILGNTSPHIRAVEKQAQKMSIKTYVKTNVSNMAEIMTNADLAIGAAGATTWERCCLGLPAIQFIIAENQKEGAICLAKTGRAILVESVDELKHELVNVKSLYSSMSRSASDLVPGDGTKKVITEIYGFEISIERNLRTITYKNLQLRPIQLQDIEQVRLWRNEHDIRRYAINKNKISYRQQIKWFTGLKKEDCYFKIIYKNKFIGIASLKFDQNSKKYDPGVLIGDKEFASAGFGFAGAFLMTFFAFKCLSQKFLEARILKNNLPAIRLNKALGYKLLEEKEEYDIYALEKEIFFEKFTHMLNAINRLN
jgi:UDP-2,4-diacetamido-2,4,6-trideoxy-beta-L-altropyranose hydrolase